MGWIFSVSVQQERDFPLSEKEIRAIAAYQAEAPDDFFVTARLVMHMQMMRVHVTSSRGPAAVSISRRWSACFSEVAKCPSPPRRLTLRVFLPSFFYALSQAVVAQVPDEEGNPTVHFEAFQCSQQARREFAP